LIFKKHKKIPIFVRLFMIDLFWFSRHHLKRDDVINFGDELSKFVVENISGKKVNWVNPLKQSFFSKTFRKNYLAIGSILHFGAKNSRVWGSGLIDTKIKAPNAKYYAVRGRFTRKELLNRGFKVPDVYGDPGLLTPLYYKNENTSKKYVLGIIPHYLEIEEILEQSRSLNLSSEIKIINLRNDIKTVLEDILSCESIVSSSLHGIIVPQAYDIPTLRIEFSDKVIGDGIKFNDYFDSVGIDYYDPLFINWKNVNLKSLMSYVQTNSKHSRIKKDLINIQDELINACPFQK